MSRNSTKSNMFSPFPTRINRNQAFQVYFIVEYSQISKLAAVQLQALQMLLFLPMLVGSLTLVYHANALSQ